MEKIIIRVFLSLARQIKTLIKTLLLNNKIYQQFKSYYLSSLREANIRDLFNLGLFERKKNFIILKLD